MTSKYEMAARARKKKRKVSQLGKSYGKSKSKGLSAMKKPQPGLAAAARAAKLQGKRKLTPAEQRRMKVLGAKAATAKRKLAVQEMDKRIAKIKKER